MVGSEINGSTNVTRQFRLAVAIVLVAALGYPLVVLASGSPRFPTRDECVRPAVEGEPVDLVFGRFDDPVSAADFVTRVVAVGFIGTESAADGCGRWKVVLENVPSIELAAQIQEEAATVDLHPQLELASSS
jgi:hypothetical protein